MIANLGIHSRQLHPRHAGGIRCGRQPLQHVTVRVAELWARCGSRSSQLANRANGSKPSTRERPRQSSTALWFHLRGLGLRRGV